MKRHNSAAGFVLAAFMIIGLVSPATASPERFAPPDVPGPFNVGATVFPAMMSDGRVTLIQVYYPTLDDFDQDSVYTIAAPAGSYQLRSPLGAVHNAQAAPGFFPLIVHDHGGGGAGADNQRTVQLPLHEAMASHGFVIAVALHSANPVARVRDLSLVIDTMLARSADTGDLLSDSIDPAKIGISGHSAGGAAAIGVAGGWTAHGIEADSRIKAMALYEPGPGTQYSLDDASRIAVPYLIMGGTQHRNSFAIPDLFDETVDATPRIYVLTPNATHFNYATGVGPEIDQTREAALQADPDIPEPLTTLTSSNAAAARAYELWNMGETVFPLVGLGFGSGRNFCDRVGIDSIRSLDTNPQDGFTDSPPFMATDAFTLQPAVPEEIMVPLIKHYTIAFWKASLEGDRRYMRHLTPGYARRNGLEALVEIE
jgi:dienelactone hydrolase